MTSITKFIGFLGVLIGFLGLLFLVYGLLMFVCQVVSWLDSGEWVKLPLLLVLFDLIPQEHPIQSWLNNPQSWYGLHKVLEFIPLYLFFVSLGLPLSKMVENIRDRMRRYKKSEKIFPEEGESDKPTLLIDTKFKTHNKLMRLLHLDRILPIDSWIGLKLYFENRFNKEIEEKKGVLYKIQYPDSPQYRKWELNLPNLKKKGDRLVAETKYFFKPDIPGNHVLIITKLQNKGDHYGKIDPDVQYAGYYGIAGRKIKIIEGDWRGSFYVYSGLEYRIFIIVFLTLMVAILALVISLLRLP